MGYDEMGTKLIEELSSILIYPSKLPVTILPSEVPEKYRTDFREAEKLLPISPRASAIMSRRLLQVLLQDVGGYSQRELADQIAAAESARVLPSYVLEELNYVRIVGNFGAHQIKSKETGIVFDVEPGEAEALLGVFKDLFDFFFVKPAERLDRKDVINAKLREAGRQELQ